MADISRFSDKVAVVTGGGSGIGQSISTRFADEDAMVRVLDINLAAADGTVESIRGSGGRATAHACDVTDGAQVDDVIREVLADGPIDFLINNAGIAHIGNVEQTTGDDMDRLFSVNVKGVYNALAAVIPAMKTRRQGVIVNLASIAASVGLSDRFAYSMTKGAVRAMTFSVAKDYIDAGIRCNCISPARVHTPFVDNYLSDNYPDNSEEMFHKLAKSQPIGRMATPAEIAGLVAYLCSSEASFITGSDVPIDGGFMTLNT
ncbi:MAG: glucose 1-dehydrogenase [Woeseiaceae bacterium]|nr:glucose 1-dehydrogenase [Woeseiaceae bacterium]